MDLFQELKYNLPFGMLVSLKLNKEKKLTVNDAL